MNALAAVAEDINTVYFYRIEDEDHRLKPDHESLALLVVNTAIQFDDYFVHAPFWYKLQYLFLLDMIEEHNGIVIALDNLIRVAKKENKTEFVQFAEKLKLHAKTEEEVLYPTAILIGDK